MALEHQWGALLNVSYEQPKTWDLFCPESLSLDTLWYNCCSISTKCSPDIHIIRLVM